MNSTPNNPEPVDKCCGGLVDYIENNPVAAIFQALAIGFAVGMVVRLIDRTRDEEQAIDLTRKPNLDDAKFHLGSLVLPFLWPAWSKAQEGYGKTADALADAVEKIKQGDLTGEGKKHLKKLEQWAERESDLLAKLGKDKAMTVEKWVEEEVLPAAECGWKKVLKLFR
ncbi:MAG: hypothetical protein ABSE62_07565 [Chthoniobacteraceae bacterium]|jgi:hypothetical protein